MKAYNTKLLCYQVLHGLQDIIVKGLGKLEILGKTRNFDPNEDGDDLQGYQRITVSSYLARNSKYKTLEKCASGVHEDPEEFVEKAASATLQTIWDQQTSPWKISNAYLLYSSDYLTFLSDKEFSDFSSLVMNCKRWSFQITSRILKEVCCSISGSLFGLIIAKHRSKGTSVTINVHQRCHLVILVKFAQVMKSGLSIEIAEVIRQMKFTQTKFVNWLKQNHLPGLN